jgi:bacterioferritin
MPNKDILKTLSECFIGELRAVRQYTSHGAIQERNGLLKLAGHSREEAREELGHADLFLNRIQFLGGEVPEAPGIDVDLALDPAKQLESDKQLEEEAMLRLQDLATLSVKFSDPSTLALATKVLQDEEGHWLWLDQQLRLIDSIGLDNWLQTMI